ncbi:Cinnamoyl-CoA reductase 1 [Mactra antiquata]
MTSVALNIRSSAPKVAITPSARQMTQQKCCETGRLVMIDPMTGGTMCSCQLKSGFPTYLSRVPTLPETVYGVASTGNQFSPNVLMGTDSSSAFYQMVRMKLINSINTCFVKGI